MLIETRAADAGDPATNPRGGRISRWAVSADVGHCSTPPCGGYRQSGQWASLKRADQCSEERFTATRKPLRAKQLPYIQTFIIFGSELLPEVGFSNVMCGLHFYVAFAGRPASSGPIDPTLEPLQQSTALDGPESVTETWLKVPVQRNVSPLNLFISIACKTSIESSNDSPPPASQVFYNQ